MSFASSERLQWHISQLSSSPYSDVNEADNFTCLEFDESGQLLAVGDKGGHVVVFKANKEQEDQYDVYCAFTSHEPEFDYLKSLEIEEKINSIIWLPKITSSHHLLSANDKTIKLWRLSERRQEAYNFNFRDDDGSMSPWVTGEPDMVTIGPPIPMLNTSAQLRIPRFRPTSHLTVESRPRRLFANAHVYHINAVSVNCDQETFLSADDLRINLWHLDVSDQSFTIVDLKPPNMEDLSEVITCARFHLDQCHLFAYSTSRGIIRLCDMRLRALCDNHVLTFEDPHVSNNLGFFADIIASLSDFRFAHSGQYVLARDYLSLKVWDIRMGDRPCELYSVHEPFRSQLCMLYENDAIFDKFLCSWSSDDRYVSSGSYGNLFRIFDRHTGSDWLYDINTEDEDSPSKVGTSVVLSPKHFVSPEDPLGSSLSVSGVCVASVDAIETLMGEIECSGSDSASLSGLSDSANELECVGSPYDPISNDSGDVVFPTPSSSDLVVNSSDSPTPGTKRRKQQLTERTYESGDFLQRPYSNRSKTTSSSRPESFTDSSSTKDAANGQASPMNGVDYSISQPLWCSALLNERIRTQMEKQQSLGGLPNKSMTLTDLRRLDCHRKLLHVSWHPHLRKLATISGNRLFILRGLESNRCSDSPLVISGSLIQTAGGEIEPIVNGRRDSGEGLPDAKAAKRRRRRRHYRCHTCPVTEANNGELQPETLPSSDSLSVNQQTSEPEALPLITPGPPSSDLENQENATLFSNSHSVQSSSALATSGHVQSLIEHSVVEQTFS